MSHTDRLQANSWMVVPSTTMTERVRIEVSISRDSSTTRRYGGTGLGLAITERAVRMHGGSVQATNAADGGLSIEMRLNLNPHLSV